MIMIEQVVIATGVPLSMSTDITFDAPTELAASAQISGSDVRYYGGGECGFTSLTERDPSSGATTVIHFGDPNGTGFETTGVVFSDKAVSLTFFSRAGHWADPDFTDTTSLIGHCAIFTYSSDGGLS